MTAKGDEESRHTGLRMGADDYIIKPFDIDRLLLRVSKLLERMSYYQGELESEEPTEALRLFLCHAKEDKEAVSVLYDQL